MLSLQSFLHLQESQWRSRKNNPRKRHNNKKKNNLPDNFQLRTFLKGYGCQFGTIAECCRFNRFYTCRNLNGGQGRTIRESAMIIRRIVTSPDSFQQRTFLKGYGCQFGTTLECCRFNSFYTCRNLNGGQGRTIRESTIIIRVSAKMRRRRITSPIVFN